MQRVRQSKPQVWLLSGMIFVLNPILVGFLLSGWLYNAAFGSSAFSPVQAQSGFSLSGHTGPGKYE